MRNYGFDYLIEKVQVLSEMAQDSIYKKMAQVEGGESPYQKFNEIWANVIKNIAVESGQSAAQRLALDYVIINVAKAVSGENIQGSFVGNRTTEYAKENKNSYENWWYTHKGKRSAKYGPMAQSNAKKEFYLIELVKENPEVATSEKLQKTLLNDKNIKKFLAKPGGYDASLNSNTAGYAKATKEEMFGKELPEILKSMGAAMPLLKNINKMMAKLRRGKWEEGDQEFEATQSPSMILADKMLDIATILGSKAVDVVDRDVSPLSAKAEKENNPSYYFRKNLTKNQISQIADGIEKLIDAKTGVDKEIWRKKATQIGQKVSPIFGDFMNFLLDTAEVEEDQQIDENEMYEGYDSRVLDKVLDSDEKWEIFDQWYSMEKIRRGKQNTKQSIGDVGDVGEFNKALNKRLGIEDKSKAKDKKSKKSESSDIIEIKRKIKEIKNSDDPDYDEIDRLEKQLRGEEDEEIGIMGYFTEQVFRDSFADNRGKFVDRGFKKPVNYNHWLSINEG